MSQKWGKRKRDNQSYVKGDGPVNISGSYDIVPPPTLKQHKIASPWNDDNTITFWHGSPSSNTERILEKGIIPGKGDVEAIVTETNRVCTKLGLTQAQTNRVMADALKHSKHRMEESERLGGVVYVSGEKSYAESNMLAGREWIESIYEKALYEKYSKYYKARGEQSSRWLDSQSEVEKLDKRGKESLSAGDYDNYRRYDDDISNVLYERNKTRDSFNKKWEDTIQEIRDKKFEASGKGEGVLFEIRIPVEEYKKLIGSDFTRDQTERYEKQYLEYSIDSHKEFNWFGYLERDNAEQRKFEWFQEAHLKRIEPKYIVTHTHVVHQGRREAYGPMGKGKV